MIGIIANPASGKDIRRLVSQGTVFDNMEKINIVQRILAALYCSGIREVYAMPDSFNIIPNAAKRMKRDFDLEMKIINAKITLNNDKSDSVAAAAYFNKIGVSCIIVLGGDGTNRVVAKECGDIPLIPLSTGTNNVFPQMMEGTVAGLAAAVVDYDKNKDYLKTEQRKIIKIYKNNNEIDLALIDAVITEDQFVGSKAIWNPESLKEIFVTQAGADSIGMSVIAGSFYPISKTDPFGLYLKLGEDTKTTTYAAIAPGILKCISIEEYKKIKFGKKIKIKSKTGMIALDGEREIAFKESDQIEIEISNLGPKVVDIKYTLNQAAKNKFFSRGCFMAN